MGVFKDETGKTWRFHISVGSIRRCVELVHVSPLDIFNQDSKLLTDLATNPLLLVDMLYACCKPEVDAAGLTGEQFGELLTADSLDEGWEALKEEALGFSQKSKRPLLKKALDKTKEVEQAGVELAMAKMDDPALMASIRAKMEADLNAALRNSGLISVTNEQAL